MKSEDFNAVVNEQIQYCTYLLTTKGVEYSKTNDRLSTFKQAALLQGVTPKQALMGMLAKHIVSVSDMVKVEANEPLDRWQEKLTDTINYCLILWAMVNDERSGRQC